MSKDSVHERGANHNAVFAISLGNTTRVAERAKRYLALL